MGEVVVVDNQMMDRMVVDVPVAMSVSVCVCVRERDRKTFVNST